MGQRRRHLVWSDLRHGGSPEFQAEQAALFAACPEAARFSDEEAEDFLVAAISMDGMSPEDAVRVLRLAGLVPPVELSYDTYRLGRFLFRRWLDPGVSTGFLYRGMEVPAAAIARVRRRKNTELLLQTVDTYGPAAALAVCRVGGAADLIPDLRSAFSPAMEAEYQATLLYGKRKLHQFLTEPEPARLPTQWEQQKVLRRLHLRTVQLRAMGRSRRHLAGERSRLMERVQQLRHEDLPELRRLAAEMETVRAEWAEAERQFQADLAAHRAHCEARVAQWQREAAATEALYDEVLAMRRRLLGTEGQVKP